MLSVKTSLCATQLFSYNINRNRRIHLHRDRANEGTREKEETQVQDEAIVFERCGGRREAIEMKSEEIKKKNPIMIMM